MSRLVYTIVYYRGPNGFEMMDFRRAILRALSISLSRFDDLNDIWPKMISRTFRDYLRWTISFCWASSYLFVYLYCKWNGFSVLTEWTRLKTFHRLCKSAHIAVNTNLKYIYRESVSYEFSDTTFQLSSGLSTVVWRHRGTICFRAVLQVRISCVGIFRAIDRYLIFYSNAATFNTVSTNFVLSLGYDETGVGCHVILILNQSERFEN